MTNLRRPTTLLVSLSCTAKLARSLHDRLVLSRCIMHQSCHAEHMRSGLKLCYEMCVSCSFWIRTLKESVAGQARLYKYSGLCSCVTHMRPTASL